MIQPLRYTTERIVKEFTPRVYKPCELPTKTRPFAIFDNDKVDSFVRNKELAIPRLAKLVENAKTEEEKTECGRSWYEKYGQNVLQNVQI